MATKRDAMLQDSRLSASQLIAVDGLMSGSSHAEAAEAARVHRTTVSRWATKDPDFIATLNERRQQVFSEAGDRLRSVLNRAVQVLADAVDSGDPEISLALLRLVGADRILDAARIGPTDADDVRRSQATTDAFRKLHDDFVP
jgi:hypothetical protein